MHPHSPSSDGQLECFVCILAFILPHVSSSAALSPTLSRHRISPSRPLRCKFSCYLIVAASITSRPSAYLLGFLPSKHPPAAGSCSYMLSPRVNPLVVINMVIPRETNQQRVAAFGSPLCRESREGKSSGASSSERKSRQTKRVQGTPVETGCNHFWYLILFQLKYPIFQQ